MTQRSDRRVIRLLAWNAAAGAALGILFAAFLVFWDVAGIGTLLARSEAPLPALALLFAGFAVTFGGAVCGTALMSLTDDRDDDDHGGRLQPIPVPVRVRRK
ncbi:MAG: hypothetical protein JWL93_164 [Hyphomicrobiales bacterium]|jgi:hypothetical protein|nr:hypothetical protein [Hyphomicrobiales bacterium]